MIQTPHTGHSLLIVEDDFDIREMLKMFLEGEGYVVHAVANGREALNYLQQEAAPCLILLDLLTPIMDGWELRERLKQDPVLDRIPVVVVSAVSDARRQAGVIGAMVHVRKPVDLNKVLDAVKTFC